VMVKMIMLSKVSLLVMMMIPIRVMMIMIMHDNNINYFYPNFLA
jgi:cytochrome c-type biogenesis protein CcmE